MNIRSILKRTGNKLNIYSFNTLIANKLLSETFSDISNIVYTNYDNSSEHTIDGIFTVNLSENSMRSFDFSESLGANDKVIVNNQGDLIIFYNDNQEKIIYQLIENYNSIDVKPIDGGIPVYPSEDDLDSTNPKHEMIKDFYEKRNFYYDFN